MNISRSLIPIIVLSLMICSYATAGEGDTGEIQLLKDEVKALQTELSSVRQELIALRLDVKKILSELQKIGTPQARANSPRPTDNTIYNLNVNSSPIRGPKDAPVTIVEFYDVECPYTIREYPKIKKIMEEYPDKVRLVLKHFPLSFHKKAKPAHAVLESAFREAGNETFWKMYDMIISDPKKLEVANLRGYAEQLKMNLSKFDEMIADEKKISELVQADMLEARKCNVRGTPTILINGLKLVNRNLEGYKERIDQILKEADKKE